MVSVSTAFAALLANGPEIIGTLTGVSGALMLAMRNRFSPWAWPVWIVSNLAWIFWAISISAYGALTQQLVFLAINCIGTWQWFFSKDRKAPNTEKTEGDQSLKLV